MTDQAQYARAHRLLSRFIAPVVLREFGLTIGLIEIPGAGMRVATWDGYESRHMSAAEAKRFARELITGDQSVPLKPVHDALMKAVEAVETYDPRDIDMMNFKPKADE